ncbi:MAG: hypothetical protein ACKODH_05430, partial [Limisphaerales bacterium]
MINKGKVMITVALTENLKSASKSASGFKEVQGCFPLFTRVTNLKESLRLHSPLQRLQVAHRSGSARFFTRRPECPLPSFDS